MEDTVPTPAREQAQQPTDRAVAEAVAALHAFGDELTRVTAARLLPYWARYGELSAAARAQVLATFPPPGRCAAAHREDFRHCQGPVCVRVVDQQGTSVEGCVRHASTLLAQLVGGRVYPLPGYGPEAAQVAHAAAGGAR